MPPYQVVLLVLATLSLVTAGTPNPVRGPANNAARKKPGLAKPMPATPPLQTGTMCNVAGRKFTAMSYIVGSAGKRGSVFAICTKGVPKCFADDGLVDVIQRKEVPCGSVAAPTRVAPAVRQKTRKLGVFKGFDNTWPSGKLCYSFKAGFSLTTDQQVAFQSAIQKFRDIPRSNLDAITLEQCQQIKARNPGTSICGGCKQHLVIGGDQIGCFTTIGFKPSTELLTMNLAKECNTEPILLHEFGHAFGLYHEHQHPEREVIILREGLGLAPDQYRRLTLEDIKANYAIPEEDTFELLPYDIKSIMHYDTDAEICRPTYQHPGNNPQQRWCDVFETEEHACVVPTQNDCLTPIPERLGGDKLSEGDVEALQELYDPDFYESRLRD